MYGGEFDPHWENVDFYQPVKSESPALEIFRGVTESQWVPTQESLTISTSFPGGADRSYAGGGDTAPIFNTYVRDDELLLSGEWTVEWHARSPGTRTNWIEFFGPTNVRIANSFMREFGPGGTLVGFGPSVNGAGAWLAGQGAASHILFQMRLEGSDRILEAFVDGVRRIQEVNGDPASRGFTGPLKTMHIGRAFPGATRYLAGTMDNVRITKDVARAVGGADFTPPIVGSTYPTQGPPDFTSGLVSGTINVNGSPAIREVIAITWDKQTFVQDGDTVVERQVVGSAISDEFGAYEINTGQFIAEVIVLALENYGQVWQANRALEVGDRIRPTQPNQNGYVYEVSLAGLSGTEEPVWIVPTESVNTQMIGECTALALPLYWSVAHAPVVPAPQGDLPWVPTDLAERLAVWLDAKDSTSYVVQGGNLSSWNDKSENAFTFSRAIEAERPSITSDTLNSQPVASFDGVNDKLVCDQANSNFAFMNDSGPVVVALVMKPGNDASPNVLMGVLNTGSASSGVRGYTLAWDDRASVPRQDGMVSFVSAGTGIAPVDNYSGDNSVPANDYSIVLVETDANASPAAARSRVFVNGDSVPFANNTRTTAFDSSAPAATLVVGAMGSGLLPFTGQIAEVLILNGAATDEERQKIEGYLAHQWDLTSLLPNEHPHKTLPPSNAAPIRTSTAVITEINDGGTDYEVHRFNNTGSITLVAEQTVEYLIVAGGGGGGQNYGGGGGGGGVLSGSVVLPAGSYSAVVGPGGSQEQPGQDSSFHTFTAVGGGDGDGSLNGGKVAGGNGGSGGGGGWDNFSGGSGTAGQGFDGGDGGAEGGGGGGGATSPGGNGGVNLAGAGGTGFTSDIDGTSRVYGSGGGGGGYSPFGTVGGLGGDGAGNGGTATNENGGDAVASRGGGGGGNAGGGGGTGGSGGSGVVILRIAIPAP